LNETSAGIDAQTVEDIKSALKKLYAEYKLKDKIFSQENAEKINKYNYREMTKNFVEVINKIIQY